MQAIKEREEEEKEMELMAGSTLTQRIARNRFLMQRKRLQEEEDRRRREAGEDPEVEQTGSSRKPSRLLANLEAFFELLHDVWSHSPSPEQCGALDMETQLELAESKFRTLQEFEDHYMETERLY